MKTLFFLKFFFNFYCYSITVAHLFSPSLHPTPAEPTSLPHLHPPPWFCPCKTLKTVITITSVFWLLFRMAIDFNHHSMSTKLMKPLLVLIVCTLFMCNTLDSNYLWLVFPWIKVTCAMFKESNSSQVLHVKTGVSRATHCFLRPGGSHFQLCELITLEFTVTPRTTHFQCTSGSLTLGVYLWTSR